ncbi:uncharacterized protein [Atheta coriaria]|uniref:uncharacterized protein n=1 Tax=Dalotia coriaria TaxID=877792 RepID=UPI0031F38EBE
MPTKKHHAFVSSRKGSQRSQDVPGIGSVYAGRLAKHNITSASQLTDLYHQTSSKAEFLREYQSMTGANSRYSGMTYEGIRQQAAMSDYGRQSYSNSTRDYSCSAPFSFPTTLQPTYSTSNQTIRNPVSSPLLTTATQDQSGQAAKTTIFTTNIKADSSKTSATEVKLNPIKKPVVYGLDPIDFLLAHTSTPETSQNIFGQNEKSGISNVIIKKILRQHRLFNQFLLKLSWIRLRKSTPLEVRPLPLIPPWSRLLPHRLPLKIRMTRKETLACLPTQLVQISRKHLLIKRWIKLRRKWEWRLRMLPQQLLNKNRLTKMRNPPFQAINSRIHLLITQLLSKMCWVKLRRKWEGGRRMQPQYLHPRTRITKMRIPLFLTMIPRIHLLSNQLRSKICWIKLRRKWEGDSECFPNNF